MGICEVRANAQGVRGYLAKVCKNKLPPQSTLRKGRIEGPLHSQLDSWATSREDSDADDSIPWIMTIGQRQNVCTPPIKVGVGANKLKVSIPMIQVLLFP